MRFLVDESCDFAIARALAAAGHDVVAVATLASGIADADVIRMAVQEQLVLLTEDKDFGQLVFAAGERASGVLLCRYPVSARQRIVEDVVRLVAEEGERLRGCFVVVRPGKVRIGRLGQA